MILDYIVNKKKKRLLKLKEKYSIDYFIKNISDKNMGDSFLKITQTKNLSIIGEIKKASPSAGIIKQNFFPLKLAQTYQNAVDAISILTEEDFFKGNNSYLEEISKVTKIPLLRKDFIIDEFQIYESKFLGANCILLIAAILSQKQLNHFFNLTKKIGLQAIVEVHNKKELESALSIAPDIIGINNRNLKNFTVDINNTKNLKKYIPDNISVISESGIKNIDDIKFLKDCNVSNILVGESFMKTNNITEFSKILKKTFDEN
jgi:indole-3-glycerol phosphate synthase